MHFEPRRTSIANYGIGHNHWFLFVVVTSFILTLLWSFFYLLQLKDSINMTLPFSWLKLEYYYTLVVTVLYAVALIVLLAGFGHCVGDHRCDSRTAAGVSTYTQSHFKSANKLILTPQIKLNLSFTQYCIDFSFC